jgi:ribonuclease VapC
VILDTSAILTILFEEAEREEFVKKLAGADIVGVGAPTLVETTIVMGARRGERVRRDIDDFLTRGDVTVLAFESIHRREAAEAWLRFGRGRHEAKLNLGDCFSYATAKVAGRPLLCKGGDFAKTDLELA